MTITTISGAVNHAVTLGQGNYGTNLTVSNTGKITSTVDGVSGLAGGTGITINNAGSIHAGTFGIGAPVYGNISNSGQIYGDISGIFLTSGQLANTGIISGNTVALYASGYALGSNAGVTITNAQPGRITAIDIGVALRPARDQQITFTNSGTISAQIAGLYVAGIYKNDSIVFLENSAFIYNLPGALITAPNGVGVYLSVTSTQERAIFNNAGTVTGRSAGAYLYNSTFNNNGIVSGNTYGIAIGSGLVNNRGIISGTNDGISLGTLTNAVIIDSGLISGGNDAIYGRKAFTLGINPGASFSGNVVDKSRNGELIFEGTSALSISGIGTSFQGFSTIAFSQGASGTAEGKAAALAGETINGFTIGDTIILDGFSATSESISANGLVLNNGTTNITLHPDDEFIQNFSLAAPGVNSTIAFQRIGSLISTISTYTPFTVEPGYRYFADGLTFTNAAVLETVISNSEFFYSTITNYGLIAKKFVGRYVDLNNFGTITGLEPVFMYRSNGTVTNAGNIITSPGGSIGVYLAGNVLVNSGLISSTGRAISADAARITNSGTILGQIYMARGQLYNSGHVTGSSIAITGGYYISIGNTGTISATNIGVSLLSYRGNTVDNSGSIAGGSDGVYINDGIVINSGIIQGKSFAVYNRPATTNSANYRFSLVIDPGAQFIGAVKDATNKGTLDFAGGSAGSIDLSTSFTGFDAISFATGSTWTVEGSTIALASGQNIYGFLRGDTIVLDNFVTTSESFLAGTGLILSNGSISKTIGIAGSVPLSDFEISNFQNRTTITSTAASISPITTISSTFHKEINLASGYYTSILTITNTGAIIPPPGSPAVFSSNLVIGPTVENFGSIIGIELGTNGTLTNYGIVNGKTASVSAFYIYNFGTITNIQSAQKIINHGYLNTIQNNLFLENFGTISGPNAGITGIDSYIINYGLIAGTSGSVSILEGTIINKGNITLPISGGSGLTIIVNPGATFSGSVSVQGDLILAGTTASSLNLNNTFFGFQEIVFDAGSTWSLESGSIGIADGQIIKNFTLGDTIILNSFVSNFETIDPGVGLVLSNGKSFETLEIPGNLYLSDFGITTHSGSTTIQSEFTTLAPRSVINFKLNHGIALGSAYYASQITITNSGAILPGPFNPTIMGEQGDSILNFGTVNRAKIQGEGTIVNHGTFGSVYLSSGSILNTGVISTGEYNDGGVYGTGNLAITNTGTIFDGVYIWDTGTVINSGLISSSGFGILVGQLSDIVNFGTIVGNVGLGTDSTFTIEPGAELIGSINPNFGRQDTLVLAGTTAGSLDIGTSFTGFSNINFDQGATWSLEAGSIAIAVGQTITGFTYGDTIILDNFVVNTLDTTYVSGTGLELTDTLGNHLTLDITGNFSTSSFLVFDPPGDTTIEAICYLRGTSIATPAGEVPIENLKIGDTVITRFNGYRKIKWIGRQFFNPRFIRNNPDKIPVRITAGALAPGTPKRDLYISPGHSMLIGGTLILAKNLVNGVTILQPPPTEDVHYFQLEFETHDCILAEGAWSESYADTPDLRAQFHNAAQFHALFPHHIAPPTQILCAPRPLQGPELEAALGPLTTRAAAFTRPGHLHGFIETMNGANIQGWAWDEANPHLPVQLEILAGNRRIGTTLACQPRADLRAAGYAQGHCGFTFTSPIGLPTRMSQIQIRRVADGASLNLLNHKPPQAQLIA